MKQLHCSPAKDTLLTNRALTFSRLLMLTLACLAIAYSQPAAATLVGTVLGDDGVPLAASITANRIGLPAASGTATSSPKGDFAISGLPFGSYNLCASVKAGGYLDPCGWSTQLPTVTLTAAHPVTAGYSLVLARGVVLQVRVNDPGQILDTPSAAAPVAPGGGSAPSAANTVLPHVTIGVFTDRRTFEPMLLVNKDSTGQNRQGTIPSGRPVSIQLFGRGVAVTDGSGTAIDVTDGSNLSVSATIGAPPAALTFTATAKP
jgi:hypothetical protein